MPPSFDRVFIAFVYSLSLIGGGVLCLLKKDSIFAKPAGVIPSRGSYIDCLLFLWGLTVAFCCSAYVPTFMEALGRRLSLDFYWDKSSPAGMTTVLNLCVSLFLLFSFRCQNTFWTPKIDFSLSKNKATGWQAGLYFLALFPFLCLANLLWQGFLSSLIELQWLEGLRPQGIIEAFLDSKAIGPTLILGINAIIIAPFLEEIVFRAGIYRFLKAKLSKRSSSLISSLCFAGLHWNLQAFLPLWLLGWWLNASYEKTGSIWTPIGVHSLFNLNSLGMLYLSTATGLSS